MSEVDLLAETGRPCPECEGWDMPGGHEADCPIGHTADLRRDLAALRSEVERLTRERDARPDIGVEQYRELNEWAGWQARARDGWEGRARNAEAEVARLIRVTRERDEALTLVEAVRTFGATWRDGHYLSVAEGTAEAALMNALDLFEAGRAMADPRPQRVRDTYEILANRLDRTVVELRAERDSLQRDLDQTQQWLGAAINDAWILEGAVDGARISRAQMEKVFNEQVIRDGIRSMEVVQLEADVARLTRTNEFLLQQQAELVALVESEAKRADGERQRGYERAIEVLRDDERYGAWISSLGEFGIDRIVMARVEEGGTGYAASSMAVEYLTAVGSEEKGEGK